MMGYFFQQTPNNTGLSITPYYQTVFCITGTVPRGESAYLEVALESG